VGQLLACLLWLSNATPNKKKQFDRHVEAEEWLNVLLWNLKRRVEPGYILLKVIKEEPLSIFYWDKNTGHYCSSVGKNLVMVVEEFKRMVTVMKVDNSDDLKYAQEQIKKMEDALDSDVAVRLQRKRKLADEEYNSDFAASEADEETQETARDDDKNYRKTEKKSEDLRLMEGQIAAKEMTEEEQEKEAIKLDLENFEEDQSLEFQSAIEPIVAGRGEQKIPSHLLLSKLEEKVPTMKTASVTALEDTRTFDFVNLKDKLTEKEIKEHEVDCDVNMMLT
jgi:hypothetical protein